MKTIAAFSVTVVLLLASAGASNAQTNPTHNQSAQPPTTKTIGQRQQPKVVPSMILLHAHGAKLADGKLVFDGISPNSIIFSDRPVRSAGASWVRSGPMALHPHPAAGGLLRPLARDPGRLPERRRDILAILPDPGVAAEPPVSRLPDHRPHAG